MLRRAISSPTLALFSRSGSNGCSCIGSSNRLAASQTAVAFGIFIGSPLLALTPRSPGPSDALEQVQLTRADHPQRLVQHSCRRSFSRWAIRVNVNRNKAPSGIVRGNEWQSRPMRSQSASYHGYRFPPDIISHAVWLYHRSCLSFCDAEDLLAQRGVTVTYETIRQWCQRFSPVYARRLRRRRGRLGRHLASRRGVRHVPGLPPVSVARGRRGR